MADTHSQFDRSIPEKYDEYLGPLLFEYYGEDLARRGWPTQSPQSPRDHMACGPAHEPAISAGASAGASAGVAGNRRP